MTAFLMSAQPRSRLSGIAFVMMFSTSAWSWMFWARYVLRVRFMLAFSGSLQVTCANGPANFFTTLLKLVLKRSGLLYRAKSFMMSCLAVTIAILTARSMTGSTISWMESSTAFVMSILRSIPLLL